MRSRSFVRDANKKAKEESVEYFAQYEKVGMDGGLFSAMAACESDLKSPESISYQRVYKGLALSWSTVSLTKEAIDKANEIIEMSREYDEETAKDFKTFVRDEMIRRVSPTSHVVLDEVIKSVKSWADKRASV